MAKRTEFWLARPTHYWQQPSKPIDGTFSFARCYEDAGYDGLLFFDTQNLAPEALVSLTAAAKETTTLGLGTGVTNPMTRHAAVAASAFSTLQVVSNGRAYLGIGRGDSALAHLGYAPTPAGAFEKYLSALMSYLRGEAVDFPPDADVDKLHLASTRGVEPHSVAAGLPQGAGGRGGHGSPGHLDRSETRGQDRPDAGRQRETDSVGHGSRARSPAEGGHDGRRPLLGIRQPGRPR